MIWPNETQNNNKHVPNEVINQFEQQPDSIDSVETVQSQSKNLIQQQEPIINQSDVSVPADQ